jgi:hypothetical protein
LSQLLGIELQRLVLSWAGAAADPVIVCVHPYALSWLRVDSARCKDIVDCL